MFFLVLVYESNQKTDTKSNQKTDTKSNQKTSRKNDQKNTQKNTQKGKNYPNSENTTPMGGRN